MKYSIPHKIGVMSYYCLCFKRIANLNVVTLKGISFPSVVGKNLCGKLLNIWYH